MSGLFNLESSLAELSAEIYRQLESMQMRIVFAESCTAGLLGLSLGEVPGVSDVLCGSAVTYRNATKAGWLGVDRQLLDDPEITAVSDPVARQMATGALQITPEADIAVSVTGHLGPGAPQGQDGLVFVGMARRGETEQAMIVHRIELATFRIIQENQKQTLRVARQRTLARKIMILLLSFLQQ